jgi:hypothetical protein
MSFNLKYDEKFDDYSKEDLILAISNKLLLNWKSDSLVKIKSPERYIQEIIDENEHLSREKIWYLIILNLLRKYAGFYSLKYLNDEIKNTITYVKLDKEFDILTTCFDFNEACFSLTSDCLISSFTEDENDNGKIFKRIISLKSMLMKKASKYINKKNFKKEIIEEIINAENIKNKFFSYDEFFFQMFIIYFFTNYEHWLMNGIPQTEMDVRAICFESVEQVCELLLSKNGDTVADIYCSTIATIQLLED